MINLLVFYCIWCSNVYEKARQSPALIPENFDIAHLIRDMRESPRISSGA